MIDLIQKNIKKIQLEIERTCNVYDRNPEDCILLAISKSRTAIEIKQAIDAGLFRFGENYLQELLKKKKQLTSLFFDASAQVEWHFTGFVQTNKAKEIAENVDWVHSVARTKEAHALDLYRAPISSPLNICIQVNVSGMSNRNGVDPSELLELVVAVSQMKHLRLRGLMAVIPRLSDFDQQYHWFKKITTLQADLIEAGFSLSSLSLGMSHDFKAAIAAGSTIVRIGRAIFEQDV